MNQFMVDALKAEGDDPERAMARVLAEITKPETTERLLNLVLPHVEQNMRTLVYILTQGERIGHLVLETNIVDTLHGEGYDRILIVTRSPDTSGANRFALGIGEPRIKHIPTNDDIVLLLGILDQGIGTIGPIDILMVSPEKLVADFVFHLAKGGVPKVIPLRPDLLNRANAFLGNLGKTDDEPMVILHVRDMTFLPQASHHTFRCAHIANYRPAVDWLIEQGYWVIRIGEPDSASLEHPSPRVLEIARRADYEGWMDLAFSALCRFAITCQSGPEAMVRIYGRPSLMLNIPPVQLVPHAPGDIFTFKHVRETATGERLPFSEIVARALPMFSTSEEFDARGLEVEENSAEEILAAIHEMVETLSGARKHDGQQSKRLHALASPLDERLRKEDTLYTYAHPMGHISEEFLRLNPYFLN
ncbi:MAG: TIGR04372 family glycosyltransferase [Rhodospirillaceae bacterium]|jgi:putative glycosyltransferase (TIGR04372 family)|nr:TIGR04372 family glycosyltransferase [Rhodospirillaceae bacterium]MBT6136625.1 TIGR04372 family glycosyltransferase [Rhodospirillaceae bacterium]